MKNKIIKNPAALLPKYFKKIGLIVIILAFVPSVTNKVMDLEMLQSQKDLLKEFTLNAIILGLSLVAWSRDKVEDEMTVALRLKSVAFAFSFAVGFVILSPVVDLLFKDPIQDSTGQSVVMGMLMMYLMIYYLQKIGR